MENVSVIKPQTFNELKEKEGANIDSVCAILGLAFPESANDFQKAALILAHLMASLRDFVLKGQEIPVELCDLVDNLAFIMACHSDAQR